ncbi:hypothetical protein BH10BAC2_BH10BAC2_34450 [soil metagenome]
MGRIIALYFLLFAIQPAFAGGDTTFHLVKEKIIIGNYANFYTDNFGNIFLISLNNQVKKLNQDFDSVGIFNDVRRYGDVYLLDVNNPLKIVLYYRDFTTVLVLDRFLNNRNTIDLRNAGILQAKAITQSYDNNYWVFDELSSKIKKIDDNGNVLLESPDFRILFSYEYNPQQIIDADGALYLYDTKKGWLIFDYYGAFKKHMDVIGWKDVNASRNILSGHDSSAFYTIDPNTFSELKISTDIIIDKAIKVQRQLDKLLVLEKDNLTIYRIQ